MAQDGETDYSSFSRAQLEEAFERIDRRRFPVNYRRLVAELERRRAADDVAQAEEPEVTRYRFEFKGNASEYFRIWIVNLGLTIVTLGIYSAWAKVRKQRYFYGNTYLVGSAFGYHAEPLRILKGRLIAGALVAIYFLSTRVSLKATLAVICLIGVAMPWLVVKSRVFSSRVTSWRGLRFNFKADYRGAYTVLLGWLVLGILTLGILMPRATRERYRFLVTRTCYGSAAFECNPGVGRFYKTAFAAIGLVILVGMGVGFLVLALRAGIGAPSSAGMTKAVSYASLFINYAILGPMLLGYTRARNLNEVFNHTTLGTNAFKANFSATKLTGIYMGNVFAIVASLGMLTPWAEIRLARYRLESIELHAVQSLDNFVANPSAEVPSATGEELTSFLDLDFGF
jgi:uncharacterized membrane protein YjgN (DUF898 family)